MTAAGTLAVALHDVEPRSYARCREIREWLADRPLMRLDVHPADFTHPGHVATLEGLLRRAAHRHTVTYDQLVG